MRGQRKLVKQLRCLTEPKSTAEFGRSMGEGCMFTATSNLHKIRKRWDKVLEKKNFSFANRKSFISNTFIEKSLKIFCEICRKKGIQYTECQEI